MDELTRKERLRAAKWFDEAAENIIKAGTPNGVEIARYYGLARQALIRNPDVGPPEGWRVILEEGISAVGGGLDHIYYQSERDTVVPYLEGAFNALEELEKEIHVKDELRMSDRKSD